MKIYSLLDSDKLISRKMDDIWSLNSIYKALLVKKIKKSTPFILTIVENIKWYRLVSI